ncbi:MAG: 23S rRNA (adenine(2503)-C(2))-methyltransferase RlmN, partial [Terriglobales bacterium]
MPTPDQNPHDKTLLGADLPALAALIEDLGQPAYRARQLFEAIYAQRVTSLDDVSTLSLDLRRELKEWGYLLSRPQIEKQFVSTDGTIRYLMQLADSQSVETVWMPEGDGGETGDGSNNNEGSHYDDDARDWRRATICISSQVGCAVDCQFCLTAQLKMKRNLTAGEIVGQVLAVLDERKVMPPGDRLSNARVNLVFMGMGEPFLNYENFIQAVRLLVEGVGIPATRMTVSTAGIVPRIYDLGAEAIRPKLAISLNGSNDELRTRIMPINRKWNLEKLMAAAREFPLRNREKLTFEYVLLDEVNDAAANAREVVELVRGLRAKVNLIALNPGPGIAFRTPREQRVLEFQRILQNAGIPAFIRKPRGRDIYAACGQLKRTVEIAQAS